MRKGTYVVNSPVFTVYFMRVWIILSELRVYRSTSSPAYTTSVRT